MLVTFKGEWVRICLGLVRSSQTIYPYFLGRVLLVPFEKIVVMLSVNESRGYLENTFKSGFYSPL